MITVEYAKRTKVRCPGKLAPYHGKGDREKKDIWEEENRGQVLKYKQLCGKVVPWRNRYESNTREPCIM